MVSMMRPSRGLRSSATTTRYVGCFFLPTRMSRIFTATTEGSSLLRVLRAWDAARRTHQVIEQGAQHLAFRADPPSCSGVMPGGSCMPPRRPFLPFFPGLVIERIICCTILNCLSSALTCAVVVPLPAAMRARRDPLIVDGSCRSAGVIEQMIASTRPSSPSSISACRSSLGMPGSMPTMLDSGPIFRIWRICSRKSSSVKRPSRSRSCAFAASSASNDRFGLLDQRQHVAHAEDAARHAVGMEGLEVVELLADAGEEDRERRSPPSRRAPRHHGRHRRAS